MTSSTPDPPPDAAGPAPAEDASAQKRKKKRKVRGAWISFVGRIVAQIIGAVASVVLGVMVLQRFNAPAPPPPAEAPAPVRTPRAEGEIAIAVLPLDNFSGDPSYDYFADGMTEALTADLAQIEGLHVISRTSTMGYKGKPKPITQVAEELGVDLIVEGSVLRADNRVRVTAQLIDAKADKHLWARSYDRTLRDVLTLQAEVATAIAREVKGAIAPEQVTSLTTYRRRDVDPAVYDLYLRGRHAWNLRTPEGFDAAIRYFSEATDKDPEFALAYAGLADVYALQAAPLANGLPGDNMIKARAAAERAVALNGRLAEAHTSLAAVHFFGARDFAAAEREFGAAIKLNPRYPTARQWFAVALAEQGRDREALAQATEAVRLDPLAATMHQTLTLVHYYGRRYAQAEAAGRRALELNPQMPLARNLAAKSMLLRGDPQAAIALLEPASARTPEGVMLLAVAYTRADQRGKAEALVKDLSAQRPTPTGVLIQWHALAGSVDTAFDLLRTTPGPPAPVLRVDPMFEALRQDARFATLAAPRG